MKVAGRDVLATWKILISLGVAPVLYGFYAFLATVVAVRANAPLKWRIWTPFLVLFVLPFMNYAALKFGEAGVDVLKYATKFDDMHVYTTNFEQVSEAPDCCSCSWATTVTRQAQSNEGPTLQRGCRFDKRVWT